MIGFWFFHKAQEAIAAIYTHGDDSSRPLQPGVWSIKWTASACQALASPSQAPATIYPIWRGPCTLLNTPSWLFSGKLAIQTACLLEDLWETHTVLSSTVVCKAERDAQQRPWSYGQHQQNALHLLGAGSIPESDLLQKHKSRQVMPALKWGRKMQSFLFQFLHSFPFLMPAVATATAWSHIGRPWSFSQFSTSTFWRNVPNTWYKCIPFFSISRMCTEQGDSGSGKHWPFPVSITLCKKRVLQVGSLLGRKHSGSMCCSKAWRRSGPCCRSELSRMLSRAWSSSFCILLILSMSAMRDVHAV